MRVFHSPIQLAHDPERYFRRGRFVPHPERAERYRVMLAALQGAGHDIHECDAAARDALLPVHTADYLDFLSTAFAQWQVEVEAGVDVVPNHFAVPQMHRRPQSVIGLAGFHMLDTACAIGRDTVDAAMASAGAAVAAADAVIAGERMTYALCRPPGHHAYANACSGFCFFNNAAVAAARLGAGGRRIAILDIDVHHGNGTQGIFYERADVLTVSLHGDPSGYFPFFTGYGDETGSGGGSGYNLNLPMPNGTADAAYLGVFDQALARIREHRPEALVLALGLDLAAEDPLGIFRITQAGLIEIGRRIAALGLPTAVIQEGGYLCDALGPNLAAIVGALDGR
jgi:acetoin utilization deacetylase AcuC-like enzyme